jgi:hypothetical protein
MTRFDDQDLTDSEFRECDLTRARLIGVVMQDAVIEGLVSNLVINGVEVSSYVEAELDRRQPVRLLIRPADRVELLQGFRELRAAWSETLEQLRRMPGRCCLGSTRPLTAFGVVPDYVLEHEQGLDRAATPSLDEVLAVRDLQNAELDRWLSNVAAAELLAPAPVPEGSGQVRARMPARSAGRGAGTPRVLRTRPCPPRRMILATGVARTGSVYGRLELRQNVRLSCGSQTASSNGCRSVRSDRPPNCASDQETRSEIESSTPNGTLFELRENLLRRLDQPTFKFRVLGSLAFVAEVGQKLTEMSRGRRAPRSPRFPSVRARQNR